VQWRLKMELILQHACSQVGRQPNGQNQTANSLMPDMLLHRVQKTLQALPVIGCVQHCKMRSAVGAARVDQNNRGRNRLLHQNPLIDVRERLIADIGLPAPRESFNYHIMGSAAFQVRELLGHDRLPQPAPRRRCPARIVGVDTPPFA